MFWTIAPAIKGITGVGFGYDAHGDLTGPHGGEPMTLLRAALGLLAVFFAHYLGRSAVGLCQRREARSRTVTWALRTAVCVLAVLWARGLDLLSGVVLALTAISLGAGAWRQLRPPKDEALVKQMFPEE
jgi:hypothetical protein